MKIVFLRFGNGLKKPCYYRINTYGERPWHRSNLARNIEFVSFRFDLRDLLSFSISTGRPPIYIINDFRRLYYQNVPSTFFSCGELSEKFTNSLCYKTVLQHFQTSK